MEDVYFMNENYLLVHGSFGNPFVNWLPWLRRKIEENGRVVYTPDFPAGVGYQTYEHWERVLKCYLDFGLINENTVIFAHSIAPVFISKFLVQNKVHVKRCVFVCGFNNYLGIDSEYDAVNESMYFENLKDVKKYCDQIICLYSDNDPYVRQDVEQDFADTVGTEKIMIPGGGHLNAESGYQEFVELLKYL